jgi:microcin C transport system substrate-binding protein
MKFVRLAFLLLAISGVSAHAEISYALSTFGDIKYPPYFKHFDYVNPDAPKGGKIILPDIGKFDNLNPYILKGTSANDLNLLFDTLMQTADDETSTSYGLLAESVEYDDSNTWVIFNLRPQAKFSDGTPVTADDVVFTFNTLMSKGHPIFKIIYGSIGSVEKLDDRRVKFTIKNPKHKEAKLIIGQLPVLSKAYYDKVQFDKTTLVAPLGSGPYLVEKVEPGRSITYKRNPDYWGKDLPVNRGRYNFDKIVHEVYMDVYVAIQALKSGAVDLRYENIAKNWANAYNIEGVKSGKILKEKIKHEIPQGMQGFLFNTRLPKFSDRRVREAIGLTLDFEWMNKNIFYNSYTRTHSYFSNSIYASSGLPEGRELKILDKYRDKLPEEVFTKQFSLPVSDGSGRIRDRLVKARDLLADAGWKIRDGKLTNDKGEKFKIEFLIDQGSTFERVLPAIIKNLEVLGIDANMKEVDVSQYQKRMEAFDYEMVVSTWPAPLSPGQEQMNYWHSSSADVKGSNNYIGIKNPVVDALVERILKAKDKDTLVASTRALDRVLLWNYYVMPNWYIDSFRIVHWDKFGKPDVMPKYDTQFGLYNWWTK